MQCEQRTRPSDVNRSGKRPAVCPKLFFVWDQGLRFKLSVTNVLLWTGNVPLEAGHCIAVLIGESVRYVL